MPTLRRSDEPAGTGTAPAQVPGAKISVCHGVGGMFAAAGAIVFTNAA